MGSLRTVTGGELMSGYTIILHVFKELKPGTRLGNVRVDRWE